MVLQIFLHHEKDSIYNKKCVENYFLASHNFCFHWGQLLYLETFSLFIHVDNIEVYFNYRNTFAHLNVGWRIHFTLSKISTEKASTKDLNQTSTFVRSFYFFIFI